MTQSPVAVFMLRFLPVLLLTAIAMGYVLFIEGADAYPVRNLVPMLTVIALALLTLKKGEGRWSGSGWRWPLGTIGFAIPAIGLSIYLHYGYSIDLHGMYSESVYRRSYSGICRCIRCLPGQSALLSAGLRGVMSENYRHSVHRFVFLSGLFC